MEQTYNFMTHPSATFRRSASPLAYKPFWESSSFHTHFQHSLVSNKNLQHPLRLQSTSSSLSTLFSYHCLHYRTRNMQSLITLKRFGMVWISRLRLFWLESDLVTGVTWWPGATLAHPLFRAVHPHFFATPWCTKMDKNAEGCPLYCPDA